MNPAIQYFKNIWDAIYTVSFGMIITLKYWVKEPPITIEYPDRLKKGPLILSGNSLEEIVSDRFRGYLTVDFSTCIGCLQCMITCPIDIIAIETEKRDDVRFITRFDINQSKCMYCGLCVEVCPTDAIVHSKRFEGACYDIKELCIRHVETAVPVAKRPSKGEAESA
ncbi:MAG: 4Fe-4S binding protein [Nitrospiraceae bacterium]|nr:MAG: 4Fe-4S binding protein [Nitrospiraceae bacterium]